MKGQHETQKRDQHDKAPETALKEFLSECARSYGFTEPKLSTWVNYMADSKRGIDDLAEILSESGFQPSGDDACLDVGCGFGNLLVAMRAKFARVCGIELEEERVEWCLRRCPDAAVYPGSADRLPWPENSFMLVTSTDVFEHLDYEQQVRAAREIARVVRPTGWAFVSVPNRFQLYDEHNFFWLGTWLPDPVRRLVTQSLHKKYIKTFERAGQGWAKLFRDAGFRVRTRRVGSRRFITANRYNLYCQKPS